MKLYELHENVRWATDRNIIHATKGSKQYQQEREDLAMLWVNIEDLIQNLHPDFKIDLKTHAGEIGGRIPRAREHWEGGGYMDPPVAGYNEYTNTFEIDDGRHRLVTAYSMGEEWAPVLVVASQIDIFKNKLRTK